jgi:hypothetical protein
MNWSRLFSPCPFGHADNPVMVLRGRKMHHECRRCQADLGEVLAGQKFKRRKVKKLARVLTLATRQPKSAELREMPKASRG